MSEAVLVRRATGVDKEALIRILDTTFTDTWLPQLTPAAVQRYRTANATEHFVDEALAEIRVAEIDGRVVGFVYWEADFIDALHVLPAARRRGVARALMQLAEAEIGRAGFRQVRLETDTFNAGSQGLYLSLGYREQDRYPDTEWDSGFTTILFIKSLA